MGQNWISAICAFVLCCVAGGPGQAQTVPNNSAFGNWIVNCEAISVGQTFCQLVQQQSVRETNALAGRFVAFPAENGSAVFLAQVPIGVYLPGGAVYRLDDNDVSEQQEMIWQRCLGEVCEAAAVLDADMLDALRTVPSMLFGYRMDANAEPIILRVDMAQFVEGVDALRTEN